MRANIVGLSYNPNYPTAYMVEVPYGKTYVPHGTQPTEASLNEMVFIFNRLSLIKNKHYPQSLPTRRKFNLKFKTAE